MTLLDKENQKGKGYQKKFGRVFGIVRNEAFYSPVGLWRCSLRHPIIIKGGKACVKKQ